MSWDDLRDPRVVPRWLPVGIHGVPRSREWDAVALVSLPELAGSPLSEVVLRRPDGGALTADEPLPPPVLERIAHEIDTMVAGGCEAVVLRRGVEEWALAVREAQIEAIDLDLPEAVQEVSVAVGPEGERTVLVDGEEVDPTGPVLGAAERLESLGSERHRSFVVRATRAGEAWSVSVDPL